MKKTGIILILLVAFTACAVKATPYHIHLDSKGYLSIKEPPNPVIDEVTQAMVDVSQRMVDAYRTKQDNVFVSAASLYLALGMTMQGAQHQTLDEMMVAMQLGMLSMDELNKNMKSLQLSMIAQEGVKVHLTNSIWMRDTFTDRVLDSFLKANEQYYAPMIASGDFDRQEMIDSINEWVADATNSTIKTAIDEPIHPLTKMFLINTLYFKGEWLKPFEKENTAKRPFLNEQVDTMATINFFDYVENDLGQFIALPYQDSEMVMVVGLPKENQDLGLNDLIQSMTSMQQKQVDLQIPKIQLELTFALKEFMQSQGMIQAFDGEVADFDAMAQDATTTGLHIASITQKTFLAIDEEGTEAAAMTKVEMRDESMPMAEVVMHVNRPFSLMIYDPVDNLVYFNGFISNP